MFRSLPEKFMQQMLVRFLHSGTREMVLQLRALVLTEDPGTIQHPHRIPQPTTALIPGNQTQVFVQACMWCSDTHANKTDP